MQKKIYRVLVASFILALLVSCTKSTDTKSDGSTERQFLTIATGGTGGTYFPLGGGIADVLNKNIDGMNATAEATGASIANINALRNLKTDVAFVQNDLAYYAEAGTEMFVDQPYANIRGLITLYPETVQIIARADSGIKSVQDLKGKRVAIGAIGSSIQANAGQVLEIAGITFDDIDVRYLSFSEAAQNLKDGNIDAGFVTAGFPTAAIQDISSTNDIVLISLSEEEQKELTSRHPFYTPITIPAGTYKGQETDITSVAARAMLAVDASMDDALVQSILEAIFNNLDRLAVAHPKGKNIQKDTALDGMSIEVHPAAQAYFNQ